MQNVGIYVRLSREDLRQGESLSIENQKTILLKHIVEQGWNLVEIYVDDGYTGGNFDRPGFMRMMDDVKRGVVNTILVKDMSRFGRDYIEVGRYTEHILPGLGCRLVALHDGMDTDLEASVDYIPFKNLFNDFYLRDCSRKAKSAQRIMAERGKYSGSYAPYGYRLSHDEKNTLLIDDYAAGQVRCIFAMRASGMGARKIARMLNEQGLASPSVYRGGETGAAWNDGCLRKLLRNEVYIGNMVQHKTESRSHKTKQRRNIAQEEHIRVESTHEPIIDREIWQAVQATMAADRRVRSTKGDKPHLFAGLLVCMDCGYAMRAAPKKNKDGSHTVRYICGRYASCGKSACGSHSIRENILCEIVRGDILRHVAALSITDEELRALLKHRLEKQEKQRTSQTSQQALQKRLDELSIILRNLYEDKALERISIGTYVEMAEGYQAERREKNALLQRLQCEQTQTMNTEHYIAVAWKIILMQQVTWSILRALIDEIKIGDGSVRSNAPRDIAITYKVSL